MSLDALNGTRSVTGGESGQPTVKQAAGSPGTQTHFPIKDEVILQSQQPGISPADRARGKALVDEFLPKLIEHPYDPFLLSVGHAAKHLWDRWAFERAVHNASTDTLKAARDHARQLREEERGDRPRAQALDYMLDTINRELNLRGKEGVVPPPRWHWRFPVIPIMGPVLIPLPLPDPPPGGPRVIKN